MFKVKDPPLPSPFEDDPFLLAGLDALDRGLNRTEDDPSERKAPRRAAPAAPAPAPSPEQAPLPAPGADPPRSHRPLLDLFPMTSTLGDRSSAPRPGLPHPPPAGHRRVHHGPPGGSRQDPQSYDAFYGLSEKPFAASTDPRFFYHGASHDHVIHEMLDAIQRHEGVIVLTGGAGLGKTTLCRAAVRELDRRTMTSIVFDPFLAADDVLKSVLVDFGVISRDDLARAPDVARGVLTAALGSFIDSLASLKATAVVVIDEVQNVAPAVLAEVAALFPAVQGSHLVQLVFVGQPELASLLKRPELAALAARVRLRLELLPLAKEEIAGYVTHRLSVAGSSGRVEFSEGSFARIYALTRGVPRLVNGLCDRALSRGARASASLIDTPLIDAAAGDLDLVSPLAGRRTTLRSVLTGIVLVALAFAGAAGAAWVFRDDVTRVLHQWMNVPAAPGGPIRSLPAPLAPIPVPRS